MGLNTRKWQYSDKHSAFQKKLKGRIKDSNTRIHSTDQISKPEWWKYLYVLVAKNKRQITCRRLRDPWLQKIRDITLLLRKKVTLPGEQRSQTFGYHELNNPSINWPEIYLFFYQKNINNEPTKQQRNVDDMSCTGNQSDNSWTRANEFAKQDN